MKLFVEKCTNSSPSRSGALKRNIGMASDYLPLLILILLAAGFGAIAIGLPALLGPRERNSQKLEPYESGIIPFADARRRFPVKYYLVAMLFLIFDIEVIFLYPWAAVLRDLRVFALVAMVPFFIVLVVGFLYEWKKGAFDWD
jgi:NADH-quinone oxidoreductase subunit A